MNRATGPTAGRLASHVVRLDWLDPGDRFDAAFDFYTSVMDIFVPPERRHLIVGMTEHWELGRLLLLNGISDEISIARSRRHIARDDLDHWILRATRRGRLVSRTEARSYAAKRGDLVLETLAEPFSDDWTPAGWVSVMIPRDEIPELTSYFLARGTGLVTGTAADLLTDFLIALADRLPEAQEEDRDRFAQALKSMIVACLQASYDPHRVDAGADAPFARESVRQVIKAHLGSARLDAERVCRLTGLSRSSLYRMFEPHGGVAHYIQSLRLDRAYQELGDPVNRGRTIGALAEDCGFHNTASFNRAFRRRFDCTPGDVRRAAETGMPQLPQARRQTEGLGVDFSALLR